MWRLLGQLGLHQDVAHPTFGKPGETIDVLLKRRCGAAVCRRAARARAPCCKQAGPSCRYLRLSKEECRGDQGQAVRGFQQGEAAVDEFNRGADLQPFEEEVLLRACCCSPALTTGGR